VRRPAASWLGAWVALAACDRAPEPGVADTAVAAARVAVAVVPPDSVMVREATDALAAFLDASREGSSTRAALPRLTACPYGAGGSAGPMLARFELLPPTVRADTVVGRAVVTTVADQDIDRQHPGYFIARVRIRSDTLEWDVLRAESGEWVVCNGLRFGLDAPDSLTAWRPDGATAATARALADSIGARR
jgi:hypothetical protein